MTFCWEDFWCDFPFGDFQSGSGFSVFVFSVFVTMCTICGFRSNLAQSVLWPWRFPFVCGPRLRPRGPKGTGRIHPLRRAGLLCR
jgi:hypothetical protein